MPLVDTQIKERIEKGDLIITPFDQSLINPSSLDVRLGKHITKTDIAPGYFSINPKNKSSFIDHTYVIDSTYVLNPNEFILGCLEEYVEIPNDVCVKLMGKSSLGRLGLDNSSVAGWVDNGFRGILTIELKNIGKHPILLTPGMPIGQLVFFKTDDPEVPYHLKASSKYVDQVPGQGSKGV